MAAIKLQKFSGMLPRISSELIPDGAAQIAYNVQLYSGDLIPYSEPTVVASVPRSGVLQTLLGLRAPTTGVISWLSWANDIDHTTVSTSDDDEQRIYYTGDGVPKITTFDLATTGAEPYPTVSYELGLPLPSTVPTSSAASFTSPTSATYERDSGNTAIMTTAAAHGLSTGAIVTIRGFTGTPADEFNIVNVRITVTSATTFEYYNAGSTQASTADTNGVIDLAGGTITRDYAYTWLTPWNEESIASLPSTTLYIKEGQIVTVGGLPTAAPTATTNFIRAMRLYRTLTSPSGTEFYLLSTLWFPQTTTTVARATNVSTVTIDTYHGFSVGDRFKLSGCTDATFDVTDGIVTVVDSETVFSYAQTAVDVASKSEATGTLFHDVAELPVDAARYWGDASFDYTDDFDPLNLVDLLVTDDYDPPAASMVGILTAQNGMLVGFFDNQLCFAEPNNPHAWPIKYRKTFEFNIVALAEVGGHLIVFTTEFAFQVTGSDPAVIGVSLIDTPYPCLAKRSVVNMGSAVLYASYGGLAQWSPSTGIVLATAGVHDWDTWDEAVVPSSIVGTFFNNKYFGSHSAGSFIFERDDKGGGVYITAGHRFNSAWTDAITNATYTSSNTFGDITQWGSPLWPLRPMEWKSKTILAKAYINFGAARVIADYTPTAEEVAAYAGYNATVVSFNATVWANSQQLGTINGPTDYVVTAVPVNNFAELNRVVVHGDGLTRSLRTAPTAYVVQFKLWQNKTLIYTGDITSDSIFRLPSGYKSDTFEVSVASSARVRAIHLGETPDGLRKV